MKFFEIITDELGGKCACEIPEDCFRCAPDMDARKHRIDAVVDLSNPHDIISMCDRCALEYLNGVETPSKLRLIAFWVARALAMITCAVAGGFFGMWGVIHFLG